jgi:peptidoglycan/LPS O-acetylase OafA/YrhL
VGSLEAKEPMSRGESAANAGVEATADRTSRLLAAVNASHIEGLDFVRAVSVLLVLVAHAFERYAELGAFFGPFSSLGVGAFFVLSGFLITRLLLDEIKRSGRIQLLAFYRRRAARLMPIFLAYVGFNVALMLATGRPVPWGAVVSALLYVTNYYQAFTGAEPNFVAHCWSLAVEEQFYALWPLALGLMVARKQNIARSLALTVLAVWVWRLVLVFGTNTSTDYLYRALDTRADQLAIGCLVAVLMREPSWAARLTAASQRTSGALLMTITLFVSASIDTRNHFYKYCVGYMIEPVMVALLILWVVGACTQPGWAAKIINNRAVKHVGKISYGLYLLHGLVMYTGHRLVFRITGSEWLSTLGGLVAVMVVATASFSWFETPMRKLIVGGHRR